MPYKDSHDVRGALFVVAAIVFLVTLIAMIVAVIWLFVADAQRIVEQEPAEIMAEDSEPVYDDRNLTDAVTALFEYANIDKQVGDVLVGGEDPSDGLALIINRLIPVEYVAVPVGHDYVQFLPAPSIVWIFEEERTKPVILTSADEAMVQVIDPETGPTEYPFSRFSQMYDTAGREAVALVSRGYSVEGS